jgi:prepilin-type N-terminal cleavage/methylation domain-containing protein
MQTTQSGKLRRGGAESGLTLVEVLISMIVLGIITTMLVGVWVTLQDSYAFSVRSHKQQEMARDALSRMVREIRDSGGQVGSAAGSAILSAEPQSISFRTAFNDGGVDEVRTDGEGDGYPYVPPQGGYYYVLDASGTSGTLYRWRDTDGMTGRSDDDRVDAVVTNVVNASTPIFRYTCINTGAGPVGVPIGAPYQTTTPADRTSIVSVQIRLSIDLNPGKSPEYMDLITTAQPRNQRQT